VRRGRVVNAPVLVDAGAARYLDYALCEKATPATRFPTAAFIASSPRRTISPEMIEWSGFALAAGTRLAFVTFTFPNLAPRARTHLNW
jgi:hypothetical protein